jgi:hypothetical protein
MVLTYGLETLLSRDASYKNLSVYNVWSVNDGEAMAGYAVGDLSAKNPK